jgi:hypothetical protein
MERCGTTGAGFWGGEMVRSAGGVIFCGAGAELGEMWAPLTASSIGPNMRVFKGASKNEQGAFQ